MICIVKEKVRNAGPYFLYDMISKERNIRGSYAVLLSTVCTVLINYKLHVIRPTPPLPTLHLSSSDVAANLLRCVGALIVASIYLQLIQNRYMFRSFTVLQCSHQHCVQPVASDVEVVGYL